jgi:hypothetical protein
MNLQRNVSPNALCATVLHPSYEIVSSQRQSVWILVGETLQMKMRHALVGSGESITGGRASAVARFIAGERMCFFFLRQL